MISLGPIAIQAYIIVPNRTVQWSVVFSPLPKVALKFGRLWWQCSKFDGTMTLSKVSAHESQVEKCSRTQKCNLAIVILPYIAFGSSQFLQYRYRYTNMSSSSYRMLQYPRTLLYVESKHVLFVCVYIYIFLA
jgi:hypothetical protein